MLTTPLGPGVFSYTFTTVELFAIQFFFNWLDGEFGDNFSERPSHCFDQIISHKNGGERCLVRFLNQGRRIAEVTLGTEEGKMMIQRLGCQNRTGEWHECENTPVGWRLISPTAITPTEAQQAASGVL